MKIKVLVKTGSAKDSVITPTVTQQNSGIDFVVQTTERPVDGIANRAVEKLLADHFGVATERVGIIRGAKSKIKLVGIADKRK